MKVVDSVSREVSEHVQGLERNKSFDMKGNLNAFVFNWHTRTRTSGPNVNWGHDKWLTVKWVIVIVIIILYVLFIVPD